MKVAVFGAGGYIGKRLTEKFRRIGLDVICYSNASGDMFDRDSGLLSDNVVIPENVDCTIYLSQSPYYRQMPEKVGHLWGVNVLSAMKVAEMSRRAGVTQFIYASTGNVYSPGFSALKEDFPVRRDDWYALSKVHAEEGLALYRNDMSITSMRIFGVYGPDQINRLVPNLVKSIRAGAPIILAPKVDDSEKCGLKVSLCYIDDVVDIISHLLGSSAPERINIAASEALSVRDIATQIGERLSVAPKFEIAKQHREFDLVADVTKLIELYNPTFTPFAEGIRQTLEV